MERRYICHLAYMRVPRLLPVGDRVLARCRGDADRRLRRWWSPGTGCCSPQWDGTGKPSGSGAGMATILRPRLVNASWAKDAKRVFCPCAHPQLWLWLPSASPMVIWPGPATVTHETICPVRSDESAARSGRAAGGCAKRRADQAPSSGGNPDLSSLRLGRFDAVVRVVSRVHERGHDSP